MHLAGLPMALAAIAALTASAPERPFRVTDMEPAVAADGSVAFASNRSGAFEIYTVRPDGSGLAQITEGGGKDTPAWSPDGAHIAYVWEHGDANADIYIADRDGGNPRRLTTAPQSDIHPFWSPDGARIVFTRYSSPPNERLDVYVINANGTGERRLTRGSSASYASFSPDGRKLVYWRNFGEDGDIVIADANARSEHRMTQDPAFEGWPAWSPDGRRIAFSRVVGDIAHIFVLDVQSGAAQQLELGEGRLTSPKWSPDGRFLYFDGTINGAQGIWRTELSEQPG